MTGQPSVLWPLVSGPVSGSRAASGVASVLALALAALLAGCGSSPRQTSPGALPPPVADSGRDGPGANPPPDLHRVPDATPRLEMVRVGGPNKPYEVLGQSYRPLAGDPPLVERGLASWYGRKFHGRPTASGEIYDMYAMTGAHKTMPLPSYALVRNPANGREVVVRINDRGPFHGDRVIDLSYTAALKLGVLGGVAPVEVQRITYEAIRGGAWRAAAGAADGPPDAEAGVPAEDDPIAEIARRSTGITVAVAAAGTDGDAAPGFWLQLGAFSQHDAAQGFRQQVARDAAWLAPLLAIFNDSRLHRLLAGPYTSRSDAQGAVERLRSALQRVPVIIERR